MHSSALVRYPLNPSSSYASLWLSLGTTSKSSVRKDLSASAGDRTQVFTQQDSQEVPIGDALTIELQRR